MKRRLVAWIGILLVGLSVPASAKPARPSGKPAATAKAQSAPAKAPSAAAPRRLQDIHIEGEIPVPQVLFITARDQRRLMDFQHRRYLKTSRELGETTVFPSCIALIRNQPIDAGKETSR